MVGSLVTRTPMFAAGGVDLLVFMNADCACPRCSPLQSEHGGPCQQVRSKRACVCMCVFVRTCIRVRDCVRKYIVLGQPYSIGAATSLKLLRPPQIRACT